ncbi:MAG: hypothetical protein ACFB8W_04105, partial [Elainellaceae cyanobacterium]
GTAGSIAITATDSVRLSGEGGLLVEAGRDGTAGSLTINTGRLTLAAGARATVSSAGNGAAGNLDVNARTVLLSDRAQLTAETESGSGGNIDLQISDLLRLRDGSTITASTQSGQGGSILLNNGRPAANRVRLADGSRIAAEAIEAGDAGQVSLNTQQLALQGRSAVSTTTLSGQGGDISLLGLDALRLDSSQISASTATGRAGSLTVDAADAVRLRGRFNGDAAGLFVRAEARGGNAGEISINTGQLVLQEGAGIFASTISGRGGDIDLGGISALRLDRGEISASTGDGQAGQVTVNTGQAPASLIRLSDSRISSEADGAGNAGRINLNSRVLILEDESQISALTLTGIGGGIRLRGLADLQVIDSQVSASTETGRAGSLSVNATDAVRLSGRFGGEAAGLTVQATGDRGTAGDLTVRASDFAVTGGAAATVSSPEGQAGNLNVTASEVRLNQGDLTAATGLSAGAEGAEINLQEVDLLLMGNGSEISAEAFAAADGGNVTVDAADGLVFAFADQDSNIIANANRGDGGNISIAAQSVFNLEVREEQPITNDIDASSQAGVPGNVTILQPNTDPGQGLTELPTDVVDASQQIAQTCPTGGNRAASQGEFVVTGRGGLPPGAGEIHSGDGSYVDLVTAPPGSASASAESGSDRPDAASAPIVEAQGWRIDEAGNIVLVAASPTTLRQAPGVCPE